MRPSRPSTRARNKGGHGEWLLFEGYERREAKILEVLKEYGISSIDECKAICEEKGIDPYTIVQENPADLL